MRGVRHGRSHRQRVHHRRAPAGQWRVRRGQRGRTVR